MWTGQQHKFFIFSSCFKRGQSFLVLQVSPNLSMQLLLQNPDKYYGNKTKKILSKVISDNQDRFMQGRRIVDNIIMVHEAIHSSKENKDKGIIIKIDMASAFDRVRHSFLFDVLFKFGFCPFFIRWVSSCISNPWISPLVNERSTSFFRGSWGLRQGYPLSPLLYIIMVESLSRKLEVERLSGNLPRIKIMRGVECKPLSICKWYPSFGRCLFYHYWDIQIDGKINNLKSQIFG